MAEAYAVRMTGGEKQYFQTKSDYQSGRARAQDSARKRRSRILGS